MKTPQIAILGILALVFAGTSPAVARTKIKALYIPLADHYAAAVVAHAKYRHEMKKCDYEVQMMKSWPSLRGKFTAGQADVAFIICPMAMDMFAMKGDLRFVSLVHRDGNALAVNDILLKKLTLAELVHQYIPPHTVDAVMQSLRADLAVINYSNLNVDKEGLQKIMELAVEGGILKKAIHVDDFTDDSFSTEITRTDP